MKIRGVQLYGEPIFVGLSGSGGDDFTDTIPVGRENGLRIVSYGGTAELSRDEFHREFEVLNPQPFIDPEDLERVRAVLEDWELEWYPSRGGQS